MESSGILLQFSSFGESHGDGIGGILSGMPSGVVIDEVFLESEIARRKGGNKFATPRKEEDQFKILSGVFEGVSTGAAIGFFIPNTNVRSKDYANIKDVFRPGHADFTYYHKYGYRDYRGGGRSSARESVARVLAGGLAKLLLKEFNIEILSGITRVGNIETNRSDFSHDDFIQAKNSAIFALDSTKEEEQQEAILQAKAKGDSIGASTLLCVRNVPVGLGEPLYYKLDSVLAKDLMGLNAVKAVEIGNGIESAKLYGSQNNDYMDSTGFASNHSGGILGGISNGNDIIIKVHFKPTPSIFCKQKTIDINNNNLDIKLQGRHDPCVGIRGSVVCESIVALVIADMLLLNMSAKLDNLKKIYG